jgi:hypothetical protein
MVHDPGYHGRMVRERETAAAAPDQPPDHALLTPASSHGTSRSGYETVTVAVVSFLVRYHTSQL